MFNHKYPILNYVLQACRFLLPATCYLLLTTCYLLLNTSYCQAQIPAGTVFRMPNVPVHDPAMIRQDSIYYLFCTGKGINLFSSKDRISWKKEKPVFDSAMSWAVAAVPGFKNHVWAPDINYYRGKYYLFYSVSTFGKNTSCIGLAINETLKTDDNNYKWIDLGKIICSAQGIDKWNAIDPNLIIDNNGTPWLSFGSFWEGIKMLRLKDDLSGVTRPQQLIALAGRNKKPGGDTSMSSAVEAPFIFKKNNFYYLFVSFDMCCKGLSSTYKMMVGRSDRIAGPYNGKNGQLMMLGGGSLLLQGNENWSGVGHNAVCTFDGTDWLIFHGYDGSDKGKSKLRMEKLIWDEEGWPVVSLGH